MSHLSTERLAALADEPGTAAELAHLATCEACARERRAHAALLALAEGERARIGEPISQWERIARELDGGAEGGRREAGGGRAVRIRRSAVRRAAAAAVLVAGGVVAGRWSAGAPVLPRGAMPRVAAADSGAPRSVDGRAERTAAAAGLAAPADSAAGFTSLAQAREARARYESLYQSAAAFIAQHDTAAAAPESPAAMRTRLAALDRVDRAMREAMHEAPSDPVINGYYLTTIGQREQTLHQLNTVLPVGMRINSF